MIRLLKTFFLVLLLAQVSFAGDEGPLEPGEEGYPEWMVPSTYAYSQEGKPDPFVPFIQAGDDEESRAPETPARPLTPLERVEVRQLSLVGIIWRDDSSEASSAMVELPDGKGFILRPGTRIGRNQGQVTEILPHQVVVSEMVANIYGVTEEKRTTLELRPGQDD
jgi:type IV pilus assembly protein PilP